MPITIVQAAVTVASFTVTDSLMALSPPFGYGDKRFLVIEDRDRSASGAEHNKSRQAFRMYKSLDGGATWSEADSGGRITSPLDAPTLYYIPCASQDGNTIYLPYVHSSGVIRVKSFSMVTETWGTETGDLSSGITEFAIARLQVAERGDGSLVVAWQDASANNVKYAVHASGAWGSVQTIDTAADVMLYMGYSATTGFTHLITGRTTAGADFGKTQHTLVRSDGTYGTLANATSWGGASEYLGGQLAVDGGTIYWPMFGEGVGYTHYLSMGSASFSGETPTFTETPIGGQAFDPTTYSAATVQDMRPGGFAFAGSSTFYLSVVEAREKDPGYVSPNTWVHVVHKYTVSGGFVSVDDTYSITFSWDSGPGSDWSDLYEIPFETYFGMMPNGNVGHVWIEFGPQPPFDRAGRVRYQEYQGAAGTLSANRWYAI